MAGDKHCSGALAPPTREVDENEVKWLKRCCNIYTIYHVCIWPYLHHGLVSTQGQQHAGTQLVFSQREQELLGLITGAHQDMNLEEMKRRGRLSCKQTQRCIDLIRLCVCVCVCSCTCTSLRTSANFYPTEWGHFWYMRRFSMVLTLLPGFLRVKTWF